MIVGVNLLPLRIEGGGARHFAESLLMEFTVGPLSRRYVFLLMCVPQLREHLERLFAAARNVAVVEVASERGVELCEPLFDLYFSPLNSLWPVLPGRPSVACLMDVQERYFPEFFTKEELEARHKYYDLLVSRATIACTISEFCRQTFIERLGADPSRIEVVRLCPQRRLLEAVPELPAGCPGAFMLYPANWYAHKNVRNLVRGYLEAKRRAPALPHLVLVGHLLQDAAWWDQLREEEPEAGKWIQVYSEISPAGLRALYEQCRFVVLPTLFEGYCMPLAEAVALGRPVLANDLAVLREVGAGWPRYARLVEPGEIAAALIEMAADPSRDRPERIPPALEGWGWRQIAEAYDVIFHQAMIRHRLENPRA